MQEKIEYVSWGIHIDNMGWFEGWKVNSWEPVFTSDIRQAKLNNIPHILRVERALESVGYKNVKLSEVCIEGNVIAIRGNDIEVIYSADEFADVKKTVIKEEILDILNANEIKINNANNTTRVTYSCENNKVTGIVFNEKKKYDEKLRVPRVYISDKGKLSTYMPKIWAMPNRDYISKIASI